MAKSVQRQELGEVPGEPSSLGSLGQRIERMSAQLALMGLHRVANDLKAVGAELRAVAGSPPPLAKSGS